MLVMLLVGSTLAVPAAFGTGGALDPAPRAATPLQFRLVKTVARTLRGNFQGAGPVWEAFSSPAIADITGDASPEIVMGTVDGLVIAMRSTDQREIWRRDLGRTAIQASPAVRQLRGSAAPDVVVATMDGRVLVLDGPTGKTVLSLTQGPPLFCPAGVDCRPDGFFGTPAIADVDGDGQPDIVASSYDHTVYAWKADGRLIFRQYLHDTVWSSPVVRDIDGDGRAEVIVGGDIHAGNNLGVPEGGLVWVLTRKTGRWATYPGYPRSIAGQTVWSTPAVGDVNADGKLDIVVGTGNNFPMSAASQRVYAFSATTRRDLPGWPVMTTGQVSNGPAIGDLDRNGRNEVAFLSEGPRIYVRNGNGSTRWARCGNGATACSGTGGAHGAVAIADLDGDGVQEVVSAGGSDLIAFDGNTGAVKAKLAFAAGAVPSSGTPTIAMANGKTLIAVMVTFANRSGPPAAGSSQRLYLFTTDRALGRADWPAFKRNPARAG